MTLHELGRAVQILLVEDNYGDVLQLHARSLREIP